MCGASLRRGWRSEMSKFPVGSIERLIVQEEPEDAPKTNMAEEVKERLERGARSGT